MSVTLSTTPVSLHKEPAAISTWVRMTVSPDNVSPGTYFATYGTPLIDLVRSDVDTLPVYARTTDLRLPADLGPRESCAHHFTNWTRFGDATCRHCRSLVWSPYFVASDVYGEGTGAWMIETLRRLHLLAAYWEDVAALLTRAEWATRKAS